MFGVHSDYCYIFLYFSLMSVFTASNASWWLYHISFGYSLHGILFHFSWLHTSHGSWTRKSLLTFQSSDSYKLYTCILTHTHTHTHRHIHTQALTPTHTHTHTYSFASHPLRDSWPKSPGNYQKQSYELFFMVPFSFSLIIFAHILLL